MKCPKCGEGEMESMGYGDTVCSECGHCEYSEPEDDFHSRISDPQTKEQAK
jgi:transcription initiation factor TFIIIB Brf1 subunit/transcription initiation factor TFIIB